MHTLIFEVVKDLVEEKHGEEVWKDLASKAGLPAKLEKDFYYSDSLIYELVKHASEALSVPAEAILELVGYWFIVYIKKSEYGKLLNMAGTSLAETLQNINSLHGHMKLSYFKHLSPPTFRTTNVTATSLRLHYIPGKSTRTSLAPLVIGLVKGLAETHFEIPESKLKILLLKSAEKGADHDVFHVSWKKAVMEDKKSPTELKQTRNYQIGVDGDGLNRIFPFHFVVNKKLQIVQQGSSLRKLAQIENDELMRNKMEVRSPNIIDNYSYKILEKLVGEPITLRLRVGKKFVDLSMEIIKIRGEKDRSVLCFVGSPILRSMKESLDLGLSLSDFAVHDPAKDRLFAFDHADNLHQKIIQSSFSDTDSDLSDSSLRDTTIPELVVAKPTNSSPLPNMLDQIGAKNAQRAPSCPYNVKLISQKIAPLDIRPAMKDELMSPRSTSPPSSPRSPIHNPSFLLNLMEKDAQNKFVFTKSIVGKMQADSNIKTTTTALIKIHESFGKVNDLLNEAVNWEMQNCISASQMFRQDNASTCIISSFCREKSKKVVKKLLMQLISNLSHQNQKNSDNDNIEVIKTATIQFLNDLISSAPSWPYEVARLISFISREVSEKKNFEFANCSINSIIFLRLLSPAIVFPTQFDIPPSKTLIETQKSLLTVSRIINNIINRMNFNNDSNLREFNDIINSRENEEKIDRFIHLLVEHSSNSPPFRLFPLNNCYAMDLRNFLADRFDELLELSHNNPEIKTFIRDIALPQIRA